MKTPHEPGGARTRCTPVTDNLSLAVIKLDRPWATSEPAFAGTLSAITGVVQARVDSARTTIQVLYDGELGTVESILRFLVGMTDQKQHAQ